MPNIWAETCPSRMQSMLMLLLLLGRQLLSRLFHTSCRDLSEGRTLLVLRYYLAWNRLAWRRSYTSISTKFTHVRVRSSKRSHPRLTSSRLNVLPLRSRTQEESRTATVLASTTCYPMKLHKQIPECMPLVESDTVGRWYSAQSWPLNLVLQVVGI